MHPEERSDTPGYCRICGMALVKEGESSNMQHGHQDDGDSYTPLFIILGLILLVSLVINFVADTFTLTYVMRYFMAGFFLVFSGFKLIDVKGFAEGYATYDVLAKRFYAYGYIYPLLELTLGLLYATNLASTQTYVATIILMSFSGVGVYLELKKKRTIRCACLGTAIKLPLSTVTVVEDFGMALMALVMLFLQQ